ncbi:MAG: phosphoribosylaminoimidazolesuccinocarboxamide synthase [Acidimicrobiales bacterium]
MTTPNDSFATALAEPFSGLDGDIFHAQRFSRGKVRDIVDLGDRLALVTTDRISAFDRVLGAFPYRGQVLNQLAAWWFNNSSDIVGSHVLDVPDPNITVGAKCRPLPVEVVVRARMSGSTSTALWTHYAAGQRVIYGHRFPDRLTKNVALERPVITPTTKATDGGHDEPITEAQIVEGGLVDRSLWDQVREIALAVFERGQRVAEGAGLILVDTKYEFGLTQKDELVIIDEVHTPDSSRYWRSSSSDALIEAGREPENMDKEVLRLAYRRLGYRGEGDPPALTEELARDLATVYLEVFDCLTGRPLRRAVYPIDDRVEKAVETLL